MWCAKCGKKFGFLDTKNPNPEGEGKLCSKCWKEFKDKSVSARISKLKSIPFRICMFQQKDTVKLENETFNASYCVLYIKNMEMIRMNMEMGRMATLYREFCEPDICPMYQTWQLMKSRG